MTLTVKPSAVPTPVRRPRVAASGRRHGLSALWIALPLVLLVAMRGDTRDTANYIDIFWSTVDFPASPFDYYEQFGVEWGFGLLSWLIGMSGLGPTTLFAVISGATFFFIRRTACLLGLSFYEVMPFYLGSFFLTQQLMQIRQGFGVALAFWAVVAFVSARTWTPLLLSAAVASVAHVVAVLPPLAALLLRARLPVTRRWEIAAFTVGLIAISTVAALLVTRIELLESVEKLSLYIADDEYGSARSLFDPANVRAAVICALLVLACGSGTLLRSRPYQLLLGLYALHLGLRIGFIDFQILSGRLSTALGFGEVFLIPMALRISVTSASLRAFLAIAYLAVQVATTLMLQTPYLVDDYFTPLHADHAAR